MGIKIILYYLLINIIYILFICPPNLLHEGKEQCSPTSTSMFFQQNAKIRTNFSRQIDLRLNVRPLLGKNICGLLSY